MMILIDRKFNEEQLLLEKRNETVGRAVIFFTCSGLFSLSNGKKIQTDNPIPDFFTIFQRWVNFTSILMASVTIFHLQASADAGLSCKPGRPVTRGVHDRSHINAIKTFLLTTNYIYFLK